jgi:chloramphenicol O-acetyltransferase type A
MKTWLDLDAWPRKAHFQFFKDFEEPFFGICSQIDCTAAYQRAKQEAHSFFLSYLHKTLVAVNATEEFRYRIVGDSVAVFETIHVSPTIGRPDGTFGFSYMTYFEDFKMFELQAKKEMARVQAESGLKPGDHKLDVIHFSALPWIHFTGLSHARRFSIGDSIPKISYGKMIEHNGSFVIPISIHAHHALMDARHVGIFIEHLQDLLTS